MTEACFNCGTPARLTPLLRECLVDMGVDIIPDGPCATVGLCQSCRASAAAAYRLFVRMGEHLRSFNSRRRLKAR